MSPVIRTTSKPIDFRMWTASSASGFTVSAMAIKPHSSSDTGTAEKEIMVKEEEHSRIKVQKEMNFVKPLRA